ncbi:MAG: efflux RND transporter periplasmic adaptor subunit [Paenibacillaceae bacterium]|nr:efflux RND transporter periplasmic adaptor subunit [Paenibacillaceae bacterium]
MCTKWWMERSMRGNIPYALAVIGLGFVLSGCALLPNEQEVETLPEIKPIKLSQKKPDVVERKTLEKKVKAVGEVLSKNEQDLKFAISERNRSQNQQAQTVSSWRVIKVNNKPGDVVTKGAVLVELDTDEKMRALQTLRINFRQNEKKIITVLRGEGEFTPEQLEAEKEKFQLERNEITKLEDEIAKAKLVAPFTGTIRDVYVQVGATVQDYQKVMRLSDDAQLIIAADFTETDRENINRDAKASIEFRLGNDDEKQAEVVGFVERLPMIATEQSFNASEGNAQREEDPLAGKTIIRVPNMPKTARYQDKVEVSIIIARAVDAVVIPSRAVRTFNGQSYVQVLEDDGTKKEVGIELGLQTETEYEVVKGLQPGQKVIGK